ncbi:GGDEF domain-containing protein [Roseateles violae]|uniref:diguanylate cyclase n=1 Tax=Roseateles violae TaxID=3058042 RepID=A0ABT8DSR4_9BURK|nr:GGDEF domain-containing protein [Pelomonas sp. PFR6]MDN3919349.1 GGDEF domain-containing protein [Pelomonas sp. PFR6]
MLDTQPSEAASGETTLAAALDAARAERHGNLPLGLAAARQVWDAAIAQGFLSEQLEAGRLLTFFHLRRGEFAEMLAIGQQLLPLLRGQGSHAALCELLRGMGLAAAELSDFETALACVNEGLARARELDDLRLTSVALNAVGACFDRMGDPWQAERLMNEAAALIGQQATDYERVVNSNNLATVALDTFHLLRHSGHERECAEALQRALQHALQTRPHALALRDPFALALTDGNRGEILLHLERLDEAEAVLHEALALDRRAGFVMLGWRVRCSLAELWLARGQAQDALAELNALLAETAGRNLGATGLRLRHAAYRAGKALGDPALALAHLEQYQALERARSVAQLMAQARFFVSRLEAEQRVAPAPGGGLARADCGSEEQARRDPLTGLGNRRCMEARMPALMQAAQRSGAALTVALIDIDRLQAINDEHGQAVGDRVLQVLAQMLLDNTRASDLLMRWGGEEILVVLPDTVADRAFEVCERLRQAVELFRWDELAPGLDVTLSIGLANAPPYSTDLLVARAESAMYRAKHLGRNRVALA